MATNGNMDFGSNPEVSNGISGYAQGSMTKKQFKNDFYRDGGYLSEAIKEAEQMLKTYEEMGKSIKGLTKSEKESINQMKIKTETHLSYLNKISKTQTVSSQAAIKAINDTNKLNTKGMEKLISLQGKLRDGTAKMGAKQKKDLEESIAQYNLLVENASELKEKFEETSKVMKDAPSNWATAMSKTTKKIGGELKDLANMFNLQSIANNSLERIARDRIAIMNDINKQFGFTSSGQFDTFKNSLNDTLTQMNSSMGGLFNSSDLTNYMKNLSTIGITNSKMAEQQMKNSIIATKYLGVSNETQASIFKFMKLTNNNELLTKHNQTIVGILKSQLGVSKEQLDALSVVAYGANDSKAALGMNMDAIAAQNSALLTGGAVLTNMFDEDTSKSLVEAFNNFMTNPGDTGWQQVLGGDYSRIYNQAFTDKTEEGQRKIFAEFLKSLSNSGLFNSEGNSGLGTAIGNKYLNNLSSLDDKSIAALKNFDMIGYNEKTLEALNGTLSTTQNDIEDYIDDTTEITILQRIQNWLDVFINKFDWEGLIDVANVAFGLYIASATLNAVGKISDLLGGSGGTGGIMSLLGKAGPIGLSLAGMSAILVGINAGVQAANKTSEKYGIERAQERLAGTEYENNASAQGLVSASEITQDRSSFQNSWNNMTSGIGYGFSKLIQGPAGENKNLTQWIMSSDTFGKGDAAIGNIATWALMMDAAGYFSSFKEGMKEAGINNFSNSSAKEIAGILKDSGWTDEDLNKSAASIISAGWKPYYSDGKRMDSVSLSLDGYKKNGLDYVPKDNYKALLHKGEMILTADEANTYRQITRGGKYGIGGEAEDLYPQYVSKGIKGKILTNLPWVMTAGYVRYPSSGKLHKGLDFGIVQGTKVGAAYPGVVDSVTSGYAGGWGNSVYIKGNNGVYYRYAHLSKAMVSQGDQIAAGQTIGLSGNTGNSTGPHLHFQTDRPRNSNIDPYGYITNGLFQAVDGIISTSNSPTSGSEGASQSSVSISSKRFVPSAFKNSTKGTGGAEMVANSVDSGISKIISYLDNVRSEQEEQRRLLNAITKSKTSSLTFS